MTALALDWALTWVWQGCLLTLVVAGILRLATRANATTRFIAWAAALAAVMVLGLAPLAHTPGVSGLEDTGARSEGSVRPLATLLPISLPEIPAWVGLTLATGWVGFAGLRFATVGLSLHRLRAVKRKTIPLPVDVERDLPLWQGVRTDGRLAELRLSERVATAAMLGLGSPVIALPPRLVDSISRADLDRIVMHEYGHVQRRDDWTIFGEALIDAAFGWHPAIWWIGRQLHLEREVASDDWVARLTSKPHEYASCLTRVAELALIHRHVPYAASAVRSRRELAGRVERLLNPNRDLTVRPARLALTFETAALGAAVWVLGLTPPLVSMPGNDVPGVVPSAPLVAVQPLPGGPVAKRIALSNAEVVQIPFAKVPRETADQTAYGEIRATSLALGTNIHPPQTVTRFKFPLQSTTLRIDDAFAVSHTATRTLGFRGGATLSNDDPDNPWVQVASVGKAVGIGATEAGQATASAFQVLGSQFTRVFGGD